MPDSLLRPNAGPSDAQWEALLRQLRQPPPQVPPFFYGRVRQRLLAKARRGPGGLPTWLRRPAYVAVLVALVLAVSGDGAAAAPGSAARLPPLHQVR